MGVTCQILMNKKPEGIYKAGQAVTGTVKYSVDEDTVYKTVTLSLFGTGNCSWSESDTSNTSTTYSGFEVYVIIHKNLLTEKEAVLEAGVVYQYPFEFHLPEDIPSSFKNSTCTIAYRIQLKFVKPKFFSFNKTFGIGIEIPVYGYVEPTVEGPVIFGLDKTLMKLLPGKDVINLKSEIAKTFLTPGENAYLTTTVTNDSSVVPSVRAELYCVTKYIENGGRTSTSSVKVKNCSSDSKEIPARGVAKISQTVPTSPSFYSITSKVMVRSYRVRVTLRLPIPHVNAIVEIPVVIGEKTGVQSVEVGVEALEESGASGSSMTPDAAPPSYWEAMREDKENKK